MMTSEKFEVGLDRSSVELLEEEFFLERAGGRLSRRRRRQALVACRISGFGDSDSSETSSERPDGHDPESGLEADGS